MTDRDIRKKLREYRDRVFRGNEDPYKLDKEIEEFCNKNNVTSEQEYEFTISGAGEMLYMLTH